MAKPYRGAARVAFLAHQAAIRDMADAGHTLTSIYQTHKDALGVMSYSQFARYVARYLKARGVEQCTASLSTSTQDPQSPSATSNLPMKQGPNKVDTAQDTHKKAFIYDPTRVRDDLI